MPNTHCTFDTYEALEPWRIQAKQLAQEFVDDTDANVFYIGAQVGAGKTHLCTAMAGVMLHRGQSLRYMPWRDESVKLKALVKDDERYFESIYPYKTCEVLYIDDFLTPQGDMPTKGDMNLAFELVNYRINNPGLITIISSERTIDEVMNIDMGLGSRLYEKAERYRLTIERDENKNYRLRV
jgi:DNA replication protein DnaC